MRIPRHLQLPENETLINAYWRCTDYKDNYLLVQEVPIFISEQDISLNLSIAQ